MDIERELDRFKSDDCLVHKRKRNKHGSYVDMYVPSPDVDVARRMISKFDECIENTGYDAEYLDLVKKYVNGIEHFIRIRLGTYTYYVNEFGLDQLIGGMNRGLSYTQLRWIVEMYGIRQVKASREYMQQTIFTNSDRIDEDYWNYLQDLSYYELRDLFSEVPLFTNL